MKNLEYIAGVWVGLIILIIGLVAVPNNTTVQYDFEVAALKCEKNLGVYSIQAQSRLYPTKITCRNGTTFEIQRRP